MRIRFPFLFAFIALLLLSSSAGLLPHSALPSAPDNVRDRIPANTDKVAHFLCFFALSATFWFILDTSRRRILHLTLVVCTLVLGVGSEVAQGLLPNDREFDPWDVAANVLGSLSALMLANIYAKRAAERRRRAKFAALLGEGDADVELGEGPGIRGDGDELGRMGQQETGVVTRTVEEELDNWDENIPDDAWDEEDDDVVGVKKMTPATSSAGSEEVTPKKVAVD
jgi:VanZ family protein